MRSRWSAGAGFDWLLLDMEHSPNDLESLLSQLQAVAAYPSTPVVRVPVERHGDDQARARCGRAEPADPVRAERRRGACGGGRDALSARRRARRGGHDAGDALRTRQGLRAARAGRDCACCSSWKPSEALAHIEAIAALDGVDGIFVGPADLHASLGYPGETANPKVQPIIEDAIRRIRRTGKAPGILTANEKLASGYIAEGTLFTAVGADVGILARGAEQLAARFV